MLVAAVGNTYTTTIHATNSCVIKLSKLTKAGKVWRGIRDAKLPKSFWVANSMGVRGGIEYGFSSTTTDKEQALHYAGGDTNAPHHGLSMPPPPAAPTPQQGSLQGSLSSRPHHHHHVQTPTMASSVGLSVQPTGTMPRPGTAPAAGVGKAPPPQRSVLNGARQVAGQPVVLKSRPAAESPRPLTSR